jgi:hypothetical protein
LDKFFDFNHPFYRPLWIRVLLVGLTGAWGAFEFWSGQAFWGAIFCGTSAICLYYLFIAFNPRDPDQEGKK